MKHGFLFHLSAFLVGSLIAVLFNAQIAAVHIPTSNTAAGISHCRLRASLPDPRCTPGAVIADVTAAQVCTPGYAKSVRNVPESEKGALYAAYGITSHTPRQYEVDHLVSLELGGSNDVKNLWPEAAEPRPGFHQKDAVENWLHAQVCAGHIALSDAQAGIATIWTQYRAASGGQGR